MARSRDAVVVVFAVDYQLQGDHRAVRPKLNSMPR